MTVYWEEWFSSCDDFSINNQGKKRKNLNIGFIGWYHSTVLWNCHETPRVFMWLSSKAWWPLWQIKTFFFFQQKYKIILIVQNWLSLRQKRDQTLKALFKIIIFRENTNTILAFDKRLVKPPIKLTNKACTEETSYRHNFFTKKSFWALPYINGIQCRKAITVTYMLADNLLLLLDKANSSICVAHEEMLGTAFCLIYHYNSFCKLCYQGEIFWIITKWEKRCPGISIVRIPLVRTTKSPTGGGFIAELCPTLATPWTDKPGRLQSMGFSRQEFWSGLPFPSPKSTATWVKLQLNQIYTLLYSLGTVVGQYVVWRIFSVCWVTVMLYLFEPESQQKSHSALKIG